MTTNLMTSDGTGPLLNLPTHSFIRESSITSELGVFIALSELCFFESRSQDMYHAPVREPSFCSYHAYFRRSDDC